MDFIATVIDPLHRPHNFITRQISVPITVTAIVSIPINSPPAIRSISINETYILATPGCQQHWK